MATNKTNFMSSQLLAETIRLCSKTAGLLPNLRCYWTARQPLRSVIAVRGVHPQQHERSFTCRRSGLQSRRFPIVLNLLGTNLIRNIHHYFFFAVAPESAACFALIFAHLLRWAAAILARASALICRRHLGAPTDARRLRTTDTRELPSRTASARSSFMRSSFNASIICWVSIRREVYQRTFRQAHLQSVPSHHNFVLGCSCERLSMSTWTRSMPP